MTRNTSLALALIGALTLGTSVAVADTVVIDRDPPPPPRTTGSVVVVPPARPGVAVVPADRPDDCTTVVKKKDGVIRDKTTVARNCD
jgi:hypothetical protein